LKNLKLSNNINLINKKFKKNQYYHYLKTPNLSLVIPIINNKIIVVSQKRIPIDKVNYEFPSGNIDEGDTALISANKELFEETGYKSQNKLKKIITIQTEPGRLTSNITGYFSNKLIKKSMPEKGIKLHILSVQEIFELIRKNKFNNSSHIAIFLYYLKKFS